MIGPGETLRVARADVPSLIATTRATIARDGYAVVQRVAIERLALGECYACHHPAVIGWDEDGTDIVIALVDG